MDGDGYPFEAIILSGEPIDHWHRFVVDLQTISYHKPRLSVNYNHNDELIIGYGENFQVTPEGLKSTGKLATGTFADEIINLVKQGVPFEASVEIDIENAIETRVGADSQAVCNGRTYQGPISIYSNVPLLAYAICPCGADKHTTLTLLKKEIEFTMPKTTTKPKTNLSKDDDPVLDPEKEVKAAVKSQDLADLCSIFGEHNGVALYQNGADVAEVRTWQSLNEKYAQYLSADDDEPKEGDPPADDDPAPEPKEDDDDEKLSAQLTKLTKLVEAQSAEIVKLKTAIPKGAEPVSHGTEPTKLADDKPKTSASRYANKIRTNGIKEKP